MSPDRYHILRRRKLTRRGDPLDQAQCNFILMCAMQQFVPFVTGSESTCPITKSSDLIAQAIRVGSSVQDRLLSGRQISAGTRESPESFQPLGISKPGRQSLQPRRLLAEQERQRSSFADQQLWCLAAVADRTSFAPETTWLKHNERDQKQTKTQQNQRSRPISSRS